MNMKNQEFYFCLVVVICLTNNGLADQPHGSKCDNTIRNKCSSGLVCMDGKCACRFLSHQIYDESMRKCKSLVRGPCEITTSNMYAEPGRDACVLNAECTEREDGYKECQCKSGYVESIEGLCQLDHGSDCSTQITKCDQVGPLFCRNGICTCKDELEIYDKDSRKCRAGFGAFCQDSEDCFGILECRKPNFSGGRGQCYCKYQTSYEGVCGPKSTARPNYSWQTSTINWRSSYSTSPSRSYPDSGTARRPPYNYYPTTTQPPFSETTPRRSYFNRPTPRPDYRSRTTLNPYNIRPSEEEAEWITPQ